ncbi:hypothetical protein AX14_012388 [Amanita brunnescens Koide BX004]|nr:hypothetical protein AX14_012388 [Amanita brunnescens Koide BX004]
MTFFQPNEPLDSTMGALFIGILISAVLHGVTLMQAHNYFTSYPQDPLRLKILVTILVLSDAAHLVLVTQIIYYNLITTYYDHASLNRIRTPLSISVQLLLVTVNADIVQCYYAVRAWQLGKNKLLLLLIATLTLAQNACAIVWAIVIIQSERYVELAKLTSVTVATSSLSAAIDITIAARLIVLLHQFRTGLNRSDKLINKIILFIVSTGLLTSLCATLSVIFVGYTIFRVRMSSLNHFKAAVFPTAFIGAAFYVCLGRLYTNSFLASLNARSPVVRPANGASTQLTSAPLDILTTFITIDKSCSSTR